jgi:hypothetical protein
VLLEGEVALGGMLGSVGQKVVAKQAGRVTKSFAEALQLELSGGGAAPAAPVTPGPREPATPEPPPSLPVPQRLSRVPGGTVGATAAGALLLAVIMLALRGLRSR